MRFPIRYQFMIPLLAVALVGLSVIALVQASMATRRTQARVERQLQGVASVLAESSFPLTDGVLRQMGDLAGAEFLLTSADGATLAASGPDAGAAEGLGADEQTARSADGVTLGPTIAHDGERYFHSSLWVDRPPRASRPTVLHILFSQDDYNAAWREAFLPPLLVGLGAAAAMALVTHLVAARISRVLAGLGGSVRRLASGDYAEATLPSADDESRDLAVAVNQTAARLVEYEGETRRTERLRTLAVLGAGLAHEMRNSATGCRMAIDLHADACPAADDESLGVARRQLQMIEGQLRHFLQMGKEPTAAETREIDLAALVNDAVSLVGPSARHTGVEIEWRSGGSPLSVRGDAEQLTQAVTNLLINGLEAASKGRAADGRTGSLRVEIGREGGEANLLIADSGDGPDPAVADRLFEPFVTGKPEGIGLGLAVTRRVLETLGGRVDWRRSGGETEFIVRLPIVEPPNTEEGASVV